MESLVGSLIGPYCITRPVGHGGLGSVFEATHQQIGRRVAIKILRSEHARDQEAVTRLFNEARAVNRIEHPGLVQIFDCDRLPDGRAYLVMEFLQGPTLTERLDSCGGKLPELDALRITHQLASILAITHAGGIIHRDLKPGNIMLVKDPDVPGGERVKLLDFGIAKLQSLDAADAALTRPGMVFGTPTYMSPEQCKGAGEVDARSDVYSLAVILFQMLAGQPPFPGEGVGVVALHLCEDPPLLAELAPNVSKHVAALVASMLAKKRDERPSMEQVAAALRPRTVDLYQSAGPSMAAELQAALAASAGGQESAVSSSQPSTLGRMSGQQVGAGRRLPLWLSLGLCGLLLLGSGSLTLWLTVAKHERPARPLPMVVLTLSSDPPGATVIRVEDSQVLGTTPWTQQQPRASGSLRLRLEKPDYQPRELTLDRDHGESRTVRLFRPEPSPPPPAADKPSAAVKPRAAAAGSKPSKPNKSGGTPSNPAGQPPHAQTQLVDD